MSRKSAIANAVSVVTKPETKPEPNRQNWDALKAMASVINEEIREMAMNLGECTELVRVSGGVNPAEFKIAVEKTNQDLQNFTSDFLKIFDAHKDLTGPVKDEDELVKCLSLYESYMQFKALFNGVFHHTTILFTEFALQAKDAMQTKMIEEAKLESAQALEKPTVH